jgi:hypothetical protein
MIYGYWMRLLDAHISFKDQQLVEMIRRMYLFSKRNVWSKRNVFVFKMEFPNQLEV